MTDAATGGLAGLTANPFSLENLQMLTQAGKIGQPEADPSIQSLAALAPMMRNIVQGLNVSDTPRSSIGGLPSNLGGGQVPINLLPPTNPASLRR